jgi:hypothetical protein
MANFLSCIIPVDLVLFTFNVILNNGYFVHLVVFQLFSTAEKRGPPLEKLHPLLVGLLCFILSEWCLRGRCVYYLNKFS